MYEILQTLHSSGWALAKTGFWMSCRVGLFILLISEQIDTISCNGRRTDTSRNTCLKSVSKNLIFLGRLTWFEEKFEYVVTCTSGQESKQSREDPHATDLKDFLARTKTIALLFLSVFHWAIYVIHTTAVFDVYWNYKPTLPQVKYEQKKHNSSDGWWPCN